MKKLPRRLSERELRRFDNFDKLTDFQKELLKLYCVEYRTIAYIARVKKVSVSTIYKEKRMIIAILNEIKSF